MKLWMIFTAKWLAIQSKVDIIQNCAKFKTNKPKDQKKLPTERAKTCKRD